MTTAKNMPHDSQNSNPVFVSEVIGDGAAAHRLVRVGDWTFTVPGREGTEPEIPDTELAPRLDLALHKLRELSGRHEKAGNINPRVVSPTVGETGGRPSRQRFYNEADALFLVTRSETPKAIALTKEMIGVYMLARRGLLPSTRPAVNLADFEAAIAARIDAGIRDGLAALGARLSAGDGRPVLDSSRARSLVLLPMMACARKIAGAKASQREAMRERGRIDRRVRALLRWEPKWKLFPEHRLSDLLVAMEHESKSADRLAAAASGDAQSVLPFRKKP